MQEKRDFRGTEAGEGEEGKVKGRCMMSVGLEEFWGVEVIVWIAGSSGRVGTKGAGWRWARSSQSVDWLLRRKLIDCLWEAAMAKKLLKRLRLGTRERAIGGVSVEPRKTGREGRSIKA